MTDVRIVVVTYNSGESLDAFLDSVPGATKRAVEVVVADNGSVDGAPGRAEGRAGVTVLHTGGNLGYGRAANAGADGFGGVWLVVANPDIVFSPGSLDVLIDAAARWPRGGSFGPAIRTPDGALYPSARQLPALGRGIGHALLGWWWPSNPWTRAYRQESGTPVEGPAGWLSGSLLLMPMDAWGSVRGFDPSYFMYGEDMDLGDRLGQAGWLNIYVPSAVVTHEGGHSTRLTSKRMLAEHHRSLYRYLARRYSGPAYAPLRLVLAGGLTARYLLGLAVRGVREGARPTRPASVLDR